MILRIVFFAVFALFVTACTHTPYTKSKANVSVTQHEIQQDLAHYNTTPAPVIIHKGYYVDTTPYKLEDQPAWMHKPLTLQAKELPLGILINRIIEGSDLTVSYDDSVSPQHAVTIDYNGDVAGALERIAALTHYNYSVSKYDIAWSSFITKTFDISFMPGSSTYLVGQSENRLQDTNMNQNGQINRLNDTQYSNLSGRLSVWDDLKQTLDGLKSPDGKVIVSESTTSVTVHDHPSNVDVITNYITQLNHSLSQEVGIRVQVVEVDLNNDYNLGIDWNLVKNVLKTQVALTGDMGAASNLVASNLGNQSSNLGTSGFQIGKSGDDSSRLLLNALSQEGKVRVVTKPQVVTMNDQIASIRITQDTGYIQSIASSQFEQYQTTTITPGTVTDGFTLYLLPKIQDDKVYLQVSSRIASLLALEKVSNAPNEASGSNSKESNNQFSAIEVPTIAAKEFNQRSVVTSGSTLIIAGYKRLRDQTSETKMFGLAALGGQGAKSNEVETLILITPTILKSTG